MFSFACFLLSKSWAKGLNKERLIKSVKNVIDQSILILFYICVNLIVEISIYFVNLIFRFEREESTTRGREKERERPAVKQGARPNTVVMTENDEPAQKLLKGRAHDDAAVDRFKEHAKRW